MKIKLLTFLSLWNFLIMGQELKLVEKTAFETSYNTKFLGSSEDKHFAIHFNRNFYRNDVKDLDEDKLQVKNLVTLIVFNSETKLEQKLPLIPEYKFQEILYSGLNNNQIQLVYTSRKAKGTVLQTFDLTGKSLEFKLLSSERKTNYILATDSSKYILHFTETDCYVYNSNFKNIDKFPFEKQTIIDLNNYKDGFLILHRTESELELSFFSENDDLFQEKFNEKPTWVCKDPRLNIDPVNPNSFYISNLIGKKLKGNGGWDFQDPRTDQEFRSKGVKIHYYDDWGVKKKERSILFESNIVYGTNPNANSEQIMGCTNLVNKGIIRYGKSILMSLEEQLFSKKETINPLTNSKKISHNFQYNDLIFIKADQMTSIQNFLIKSCRVNMDENQLGSSKIYFKADKIKVLYNQTYIREKKQKLLGATLNTYLDTESKSLIESFNQSGLNIVLYPTDNYVKSKYFLALQNGFLDLILLEE